MWCTPTRTFRTTLKSSIDHIYQSIWNIKTDIDQHISTILFFTLEDWQLVMGQEPASPSLAPRQTQANPNQARWHDLRPDTRWNIDTFWSWFLGSIGITGLLGCCACCACFFPTRVCLLLRKNEQPGGPTDLLQFFGLFDDQNSPRNIDPESRHWKENRDYHNFQTPQLAGSASVGGTVSIHFHSFFTIFPGWSFWSISVAL